MSLKFSSVLFIKQLNSFKKTYRMWNQTYKKLSVIKLSTDFAEATKIFKVPLIAPNDNQVLVKNLYAGVNASDINISAGRYFTDGKIPFDIGFEV